MQHKDPHILFGHKLRSRWATKDRVYVFLMPTKTTRHIKTWQGWAPNLGNRFSWSKINMNERKQIENLLTLVFFILKTSHLRIIGVLPLNLAIQLITKFLTGTTTVPRLLQTGRFSARRKWTSVFNFCGSLYKEDYYANLKAN